MYSERLGALSSKWDVVIKPLLPSGFRDLCRRGGRKTVRAKGYKSPQGNSGLQIQQAWCTYEHTGAAHKTPATTVLVCIQTHTGAACKRPARFKADSVSALGAVSEHRLPRSCLQLMPTGKGTGKFSSEECHSVCQSYSRVGLNAQE